MLINKQKYKGGGLEALNYKFEIFNNVYGRVGLLYKQYITTFPLLLKDLAQNYYYTNRDK